MGVSIGYRLKAVAIVLSITALLLIAISGALPAQVDARANLTAYKSVTPNGWEPEGYNVTGTVPYYITHTLGWNNVKIMGNVGIGNGGVQYLNGTSNQNINYTDNNFMAGDVSEAPWDPGRLTSAPGVAVNSATAATGVSAGKNSIANNTSSTSGNTSQSMINIPDIGKLSFDNNTPAGTGNESTLSANDMTIVNSNQISVGNKFSNMPLNDPYHSILLGRPVDDLMYEYPLAPTISAYFKLVGIPMPCGSGLASFSMRCLGYGY
ncbi:MAG TPA: hypothetical protein VMC84_03345 [Methanocella sp.]|uniref:hypothetical protein n=1 Tax=Methanocella sp. TaxID=2052833 RepID=UPI002BD0D7C0|nr:hypothetical protein [Methanocella sp.]HTY90189.1 hypothetical protein [Methanocella sp.]